MKKNLFNIGCIFALLASVALGTTSCSKDDDSNPTLDLSHAGEGFVLNVPANAANNTYDLAAAENVELTCHQPNYGGVPYVTRYYVQVAIDQNFLTDSTTAHKELKTSYTSADMMVAANEMNDSIVALSSRTPIPMPTIPTVHAPSMCDFAPCSTTQVLV